MATRWTNGAFAGLRGKWQHMRRKRKSLAELATFPPSDLQHIAQDVGVSVSDLRVVAAAHRGPGELLPRRLTLLGLDPAYIVSAQTTTYRDLERTCAMCPAWRRCARDLAKGDVQAGMGTYCLCAQTIDALSVDRTTPPSDMTTEPWLPDRHPVPWPMYRRAERRAVRMREMMQRLDVDPGKLARLRSGNAYLEGRARCLSCSANNRCLQWLDSPVQAEGRAEFCPNLALFEACRRGCADT
jgi:hypothetical protein